MNEERNRASWIAICAAGLMAASFPLEGALGSAATLAAAVLLAIAGGLEANGDRKPRERRELVLGYFLVALCFGVLGVAELADT